jgi:hypothetical protein
MQKRWATVSKEIGLSKPIMQRTAARGNTSRLIVALEKVAGSIPVGHPREVFANTGKHKLLTRGIGFRDSYDLLPKIGPRNSHNRPSERRIFTTAPPEYH